MAKIRSWEVSDEFWKRVAPFIPKRERESGKAFKRKPGGGRKAMSQRRVFEGIVFVLILFRCHTINNMVYSFSE